MTGYWGRLRATIRLIGQTNRFRNDDPSYHYKRGCLFQDMGKLDEAMSCYKKALDIKPDYAPARINLGNIFQSRGQIDDAIAHYKMALRAEPRNAVIHNNLGAVLRIRGMLEDAKAHCKKALALNPDFAEAHNNLGNVFTMQDRIDDALACYKRAIALNPKIAMAHDNLGNILRVQGHLDDAIICYERAIALKPSYAEAHNNLGLAYKEKGMLDEAMACYSHALALKPASVLFHSNLLMDMIYVSSISPAEQTAMAREFGNMRADPLRRQRPIIRDKDPERKLRIGYVSPDLREHAVNYFFEPMLKLHDRQKFEVFIYSNVMREDHITARLKQKADHWRDLKFLNDDQAADLIEMDNIDILVDMAGHTANNRLMVFARKPAPIQATWLGYPATTGMAAMDYRITDGYADPPGLTEHLNTENLWRLPEIFCCYQPHEKSPDVIDHPPFEDNGYITFGCFNNFAKVTDSVLRTWAQILAQVPNSRLLLEIRGLEGKKFRSDVETRLHHAGLPPDRVILEPRKKSNQFVLYNKIDMALDPFPCVGGTTSMDTVWMGVPFVTLAGQHYVSRMGVTILTNASLSELIARNVEEYVAIAVGLALDEVRLHGLRHNLRQKVTASPLMNQAAFTRNMEAAYRGMWRKWCDSVSPL